MQPLRPVIKDEQVDQFTASLNTDGVEVKDMEVICAMAVILNSTPSAKTFLAGVKEVDTLTLASLAGTTSKDYVVVTDTNGLTWAIYADKTGSDTAPTGAAYVAVNASRKNKADISGATTAAQVAALFKTAFEALTGFTSVVTITDPTDGTLLFTHTARGPVTNPVPHNATDSGAGSISVTESTPGVASKVDVTANTISISAHGLPTGLKGQGSSTGTLPGGLSTSTDYYVIVVDANTIKLATSYANALAGTAIDILDQGTNAVTHTFTPTSIAGGTIKPQGSLDGTNYADIKSPEGASLSQNITATGNFLLNFANPGYNYFRLAYGLTAGYLETTTTVQGKNRV
jgi:hypothetical protein